MASISSLNPGYNAYDTGMNGATTSVQVATNSSQSAAQDAVELSAQAQAESLYQQGTSVSTIAADLGIDAKTVDSYLNLKAQSEPQQVVQITPPQVATPKS